jgi:3-oxoacyl-[acyl-carrier-protein] synthase-3
MGSPRIAGVGIRGIVSVVPDRERSWEQEAERFGLEEMRRVVKNIGVTRRTIAKNLCTSDLCQAAAEDLLAKLGWAKESVDAVVMVTQTPDYPSPSTACLVQQRMGLSKGIAAFDINLGCSGYTYGIWVVASLLTGGGIKRALLLAGDTVSRGASPHDRSVVPLFGDAGSATALEHDPAAPPLVFEFGTDGAGAIHLHTLAGGGKHPVEPDDHVMYPRHDGIVRSNLHTYMNGAEVLTFAIQNVPKMIATLRSAVGWSADEVDKYVFHQASHFMLKNIGLTMRVPAASNKIVYGMEGYGNTSSASIPLAMNDQLGELNERAQRLVLGGFGIGWSWCAVAVPIGPIYLPPPLRIPDVKHPSEFDALQSHAVVGPAVPPER